MFRSKRRTPGPGAPAAAVPRRQTGQTDEEYRQVLIDCIDEIDRTKRDIKSQIHHAALEARQAGRGIEQAWLRRAKDKMDHLTVERTEVRNTLHSLNEGIKQRRRAQHGYADESLAREFMRTARQVLDPELYDRILDEASLQMVTRREPDLLRPPPDRG